MSFAENLAKVRATIAEAARAAGRDPSEITLVAATKTQTGDTIRTAVAAGTTAQQTASTRQQEMPKDANKTVETSMTKTTPQQ